MMKSDPNGPTFLFDDLPLQWQMTRCEKFGLASLLQAAQPEVAIEIGTYKGGSLQLISVHSTKTYSIDISPVPRETLSDHFRNVELLTGESNLLVPEVLKKITGRGEDLGFVLIDGDHSTEGVRSDIEALLHHEPTTPVYVVIHDSFHPPCRKGILDASWQECPFVHYVEVDFIPGVYHFHAFDTASPKSMYGGLAVALMRPEQRSEDLIVHQTQAGLFETVLKHSCHVESRGVRDLLRRVETKLFSWARRGFCAPTPR